MSPYVTFYLSPQTNNIFLLLGLFVSLLNSRFFFSQLITGSVENPFTQLGQYAISAFDYRGRLILERCMTDGLITREEQKELLENQYALENLLVRLSKKTGNAGYEKFLNILQQLFPHSLLYSELRERAQAEALLNPEDEQVSHCV